MAKSRAEKAGVLEALRERFSKAESMVLADYRGLDVAEMTELRRKLRESQVEFAVVKNTLAWRVARDLGLEDLRPHLEGPTAIAFGMKDAVAPAKGITNFIKDKKKLEIKAGVLNGKVINLDEVKALAELPSREVLLAKALGCLRAPLAGLATVLQAPLRGFVTAVDALRREREGS